MNPSEVARYPVEVFWSDEDEGYIAVVPDLPGCSAWGETETDALREGRDAIASWIQAATAVDNPVPPPSIKRAPNKHSGKILLRVPRSLHAELADQAEQDGVSLNQFIVSLVSAAATARSCRAVAEQQMAAVLPLTEVQAGTFPYAGTVIEQPSTVLQANWPFIHSGFVIASVTSTDYSVSPTMLPRAVSRRRKSGT